MSEQPLNLRASLHEIWRHRLFVLTVALACGLTGAMYGFLKPAAQSADALVILPPSAASSAAGSGNTGNSGAAGSSIATEAVIAKSTPVLSAAGAKLSPPMGVLGIKKLVTITPLSNQILQVQAQGTTSGAAASLANAVAQSYIDYLDQLAISAEGANLDALRQESSQLNQQVRDLQTQINTVFARISAEGTGSPRGQQDTALISALQNEQNQVAVQLNNVNNQIASSNLPSGSVTGSARLLQSATAQPASAYRLPVEAGLIGLTVGLLVGVTFVLIRAQRRHQLRHRDELARVAGAPVLASFDAPSCKSPSAWREVLGTAPGAATEWSLRHVLHSLPHGGRPAIRVISFAGDTPALTTAPRLALQAAHSGMPTALLTDDATTHSDRALLSFRAACRGNWPADPTLPLTFADGTPADPASHIVVSLLVVDHDAPAVSPSAAHTLLSVSADYVTADELARLALAVADSGSTLAGVVVVNPDPLDTTTGQPIDAALRPLASTTFNGSDQDLLDFHPSASRVGTSSGLPTRGER